jgi:hypothetical protein
MFIASAILGMESGLQKDGANLHALFAISQTCSCRSSGESTSASSKGTAIIGGWITDLEPPQKVMFGSSRLWCHSPPKRGAYRNVDPTGRIAALEMLGALLLTSLLIHHMEVHIFYAFSLR